MSDMIRRNPNEDMRAAQQQVSGKSLEQLYREQQQRIAELEQELAKSHDWRTRAEALERERDELQEKLVNILKNAGEKADLTIASLKREQAMLIKYNQLLAQNARLREALTKDSLPCVAHVHTKNTLAESPQQSLAALFEPTKELLEYCQDLSRISDGLRDRIKKELQRIEGVMK